MGADATIHVDVVATDARMRQTLDRSRREMVRWGREMRTLGSGLTFNPITSGIAAIGVVAANTYAEYEKHINRVQAVTGAAVDMMAKLRNQALELGKGTIFSAMQAAEGMGFLGMAGFDALEVFKAMPGVTKLAAIGMTTVSKAADIATNILLGFGLEVNNLARVNDILSAAITDSNTDLRKLGSALSYAAPLAKAAGWGIEAATAAIMSVSDAGIQGTRAGTSLRNMIMRLTKPSAKAAEIMKHLGIEVLDSSGNLKDMDKILEEFTPHMEKAGEMSAIFGARAVPGMLKLLRSGVSDFREDLEHLMTSFGDADEMADVMLQGFYGKWVRLKSAIHTLGIEMGEALSGPLGDIAVMITDKVVPAVSEMVGWFEELPRPVQYGAIAIVGLTAAIGPLLWALGPMAMGLGYVIDGFSKLGLAGGITSTLSTLRALMGGIGDESNKTAKAVGSVAAAAAGVAGVGAAAKGARPFYGAGRRTRQDHGLFRQQWEYPGDVDANETLLGLRRLKEKASVIGTHPRGVAFGLSFSRIQTDSVKEMKYAVKDLGNGVKKLVSEKDDLKSFAENIGEIGKHASKFRNLTKAINPVGLAIAGLTLVSEKFGNIVDQSIGVGISLAGLLFRNLANDAKNAAERIVSIFSWASDKIDSLFGGDPRGHDLSQARRQEGWGVQLANVLSGYRYYLQSFEYDETGRPHLRPELPGIDKPEGFGEVPESFREHGRLPGYHDDKRYDFSKMVGSVQQLEENVRKAREAFLAGVIGIEEYETALNELSEGKRGKAFHEWLRQGDRSIADQIKWLADYERAIEEVYNTLDDADSVAAWSRHFERARKDLISGKIGLSEFTAAIDGLEDAKLRDAAKDWLKDPANDARDFAAYLERLENVAGSIENLFVSSRDKVVAAAAEIGKAWELMAPGDVGRFMQPGATFGQFDRGVLPSTPFSGAQFIPPDWGLQSGAERRVSQMFKKSDDSLRESEETVRALREVFNDLGRSIGGATGQVISFGANLVAAFMQSKWAGWAAAIGGGISAVIGLFRKKAAEARKEVEEFEKTVGSLYDEVRSGAISALEAQEKLNDSINKMGAPAGIDTAKAREDLRILGRTDDEIESIMATYSNVDPELAAKFFFMIAESAAKARLELEKFNAMAGIATDEQTNDIEATREAWARLTDEQRETTRAQDIYAQSLYDARDAGIALTEAEKAWLLEYERKREALDNLTSSLQAQLTAYFNIADTAKETYDSVYDAAIKAGLSEEAAAEAAAKYQAEMAEWLMQVEEVKFKRQVFLAELLRVIREEAENDAASAAESAAERALEAWAKAAGILDDPKIQELLAGMQLPDRPVRPFQGAGGGSSPQAKEAERIAKLQEDLKRQMLGLPTEQAVGDFNALNAAWAQLTLEQQWGSEALGIYANGLIKARDAGVELNDEMKNLISTWEKQKEMIDLTANAVQSQVNAYWSLSDNAKSTYDGVYNAAIEAGESEQQAARDAAEYQAAMADWTMEVEETKFKRMVFLDELLRQIRIANEDEAADSAENAANRAVTAWAKAKRILDAPGVRGILDSFKMPDRPEAPTYSKPASPTISGGSGSSHEVRVSYTHITPRKYGGHMTPGMDYIVGDAGPEVLRIGGGGKVGNEAVVRKLDQLQDAVEGVERAVRSAA